MRFGTVFDPILAILPLGSSVSAAGLLVDGWHSPPCFMMTYNRPYYEDLVEDYGFEKVEDLVAFYAPTDIVDRLDPKLYKVIDIAKKKFNLKLRKLDKTRFDEEVHTFLDIYNKSLPGTWGFNPLSGAELKHMAKGLKHLLVPELTCFAEVEGKVIGACVALLDYNDIIKEIDGIVYNEHPYVLDHFGPAQRVAFWNKFSMPDFGALRFADKNELMYTWWIDQDKLAKVESGASIPIERAGLD
jgi:hypothetical protein